MYKSETRQKVTIFTGSPEQTFGLGKKLGKTLRSGNNVALLGNLGSGKTLLTQGIARGLGVPGNVYVTSPTFTIINEYPGRIPVYHVDLYRISDEDELIELGLDELMGGDGVVIIEWAEKLPVRFLRDCNIKVELRVIDSETRKIIVTSDSEKVLKVVSNLVDQN